MFGEQIRSKRLAMGLSLRTFCQQFSEDPGNWSKMERGLLQPPLESARLAQIAGYLGLDLESEEFDELLTLAHAERGRVPERIMNDEQLVSLLPVMFRTMTKESPATEDLLRLADKIRKANSPL